MSSVCQHLTRSLLVVTRHGRVCRNWNHVNVTGHKGSYWKHIWSRLPVWARISAKSDFFALLISKSAATPYCGLWTPTYLPESPTLHLINHSAYQFFIDVTVAQGEYWNAKSTKRVTVTRSYWIDWNGIVSSGQQLHELFKYCDWCSNFVRQMSIC
jgi:hypothetical protein